MRRAPVLVSFLVACSAAPPVAAPESRTAPRASSQATSEPGPKQHDLRLFQPRDQQVTLPTDPHARATLERLRGVCRRAWAQTESGVEVGCLTCPRKNDSSGLDLGIVAARPEMQVSNVWVGSFTRPATSEALIAYYGCGPSIFQHSGALLVDLGASPAAILEDYVGLNLEACRFVERKERDVLVCVRRKDYDSMMIGRSDLAIGTLDVGDPRAKSSDDPTDHRAWRELPLFTADAGHLCAAGHGPDAIATTGRVLDVDVSAPGTVVVSTLFGKAKVSPAFDAVCQSESWNFDALLGAKPVKRTFALRGSQLTETR